jgi:hypothetical protein
MAESAASSEQGMAAADSASVKEDELQQLDARTELVGPVAHRHYGVPRMGNGG